MVDRCVVCGAIIPEGRHVCPMCLEKVTGVSFHDICMVVNPSIDGRSDDWCDTGRVVQRREE